MATSDKQPAPAKPKREKRKPRTLDEQKADLEKRIADRDCADACDRAILDLRRAKAAKDWEAAIRVGDDLGNAIAEHVGDGFVIDAQPDSSPIPENA